MHKLLIDRVRLIRGLQAAQSNGFSEIEKATIASLIQSIRHDPHSHFLSYSQDEPFKVSYARQPAHQFDSTRRVRTTLGKYIRRQLGIQPAQLKDDLLDALCGYVFQLVQNEDADYDHFQFFSGEAITNAYRTGPGSCMSGSCAHYTEFYAINPDKVQLMVYNRHLTIGEQDMFMKSRALLWTADDGRRMLDRIYISIGGSRHNEGDCCGKLGADDECVCRKIIRKYRRWALRHNVINRKSLVDDFQITMRIEDYVPYVDTLLYGSFTDYDTIVISNRNGTYTLQRTDGRRPDDEDSGYLCTACDDHIDGDDVHWAFDHPYCECCFYDRFFYCTHCGREERRDDSIIVNDERYCQTCADALFKLCEDCSTYYSAEDLNKVHTADGEALVCDTCLNGYLQCSECGEHFAESLTITHADGTVYCKECHEENVAHQEAVRQVDQIIEAVTQSVAA